MNKNTLIGLVLIGAILFGFSWYNSKQYEKQKAEQAELQRKQYIEDSILMANAPKPQPLDSAQLEQKRITDSIAQAQQIAALGEIAKARMGEEEFHTLENELFKIKFSNRGGRIAAVELKDYKKYGGDPLMLFNEKGSNFGIQLYTPELINTAELYMEARDISPNGITYRLTADSASYLEFKYQIKPDNYMMDMSIDMSNFRGRLAMNQPDVKLDWEIVSPQQEKGFKNENTYTTITYRFPGTDNVEDIGISEADRSEEITTKVEWVGFKQQFFSSMIISKDNFVKSNLSYNTFPTTDKNIKDFKASLTLPYTPETKGYDLSFYFGPNKYSTLKKYEGLAMEEIVPLGWGIFGWVNRFIIIPTFDFLGGFISNFGIVILFLTIFIKIIIFPMTYKSYLSTAKMRLLRPEMVKIGEKYPKKEDAMKKQQATMELYKKAGVSPMGGCVPMLIQMPILFAMFRFFPSAIELRQESFLWADDLSSYDSIFNFPGGFSIPFYGDHISLFTLLMAVTLFISSKLNYNQQAGGAEQMPGMKFMTLYMMPLMLLVFFNNSSAGLSWYYFLSSLITIGQTYLFRLAVSDAKLHARMQENAKKPVKKSKFAARLEEMQKQAAAQQQGQQKNKKK